MTAIAVLAFVAVALANHLGSAQEIAASDVLTESRDGVSARFLDDYVSDYGGGSDDDNQTETKPWSPLCGQCQTVTNIIIPLFFLGWNTAMANMMLPAVIIPMSHCEWSGVQWILVVFPHWYAGLLMPGWIGGLIAVAVVALPYVFAICQAKKRGLLGCCPPPEASHVQYAAAADRDGVRVAPGDEVEAKLCGKWRAVTLVRMRADDQTWRVRAGKCTRPGVAARVLRQVGSERPGENADAAAAATAAAQAERIAELEAQVKNLTDWQARQQEPPLAAAAAVAVPEAVPIPPEPAVGPVGAWRPASVGPAGGVPAAPGVAAPSVGAAGGGGPGGRAQVYMTGQVVDVVTL